MKPPTAAGYDLEQLERVRSVCLYVATKLADIRDEWVIIGGLVPSLLIDQQRLQAADRHVGTLDLDLGLQLGILEEGGYREISARLREAGFGPDSNEAGNVVRQRWKHPSAPEATVEFLIPPAPQGQRGAFLVLKALAFEGRGANKDAYDIYYVLQHYEGGLDEIAQAIRAFAGEGVVQQALEGLHRDFRRVDGAGAMRAGTFLGLATDDFRGQVVGLVDSLLRRIE